MSDSQKMFSTITTIIEELFEIPKDSIQREDRLFEDLDLDSIDAVDLVAKLQEFTGRRIHPSEFKSVRSIEDVILTALKILEEDDVPDPQSSI